MSARSNNDSTKVPVFLTAYTESEFEIRLEKIVEKVVSKHLINASSVPDPEELLTREQAIKEFGVSRGTLYNREKENLLTPCRNKGILRFKRKDLQAVFSGNTPNQYRIPNIGKKNQ